MKINWLWVVMGALCVAFWISGGYLFVSLRQLPREHISDEEARAIIGERGMRIVETVMCGTNSLIKGMEQLSEIAEEVKLPERFDIKRNKNFLFRNSEGGVVDWSDQGIADALNPRLQVDIISQELSERLRPCAFAVRDVRFTDDEISTFVSNREAELSGIGRGGENVERFLNEILMFAVRMKNGEVMAGGLSGTTRSVVLRNNKTGRVESPSVADVLCFVPLSSGDGKGLVNMMWSMFALNKLCPRLGEVSRAWRELHVDWESMDRFFYSDAINVMLCGLMSPAETRRLSKLFVSKAEEMCRNPKPYLKSKLYQNDAVEDGNGIARVLKMSTKLFCAIGGSVISFFVWLAGVFQVMGRFNVPVIDSTENHRGAAGLGWLLLLMVATALCLWIVLPTWYRKAFCEPCPKIKD